MFRIDLPIDGMTCTGCATRLQRVLETTDGIGTATVLLEARQAQIEYDPERIDPADIHAAIAAAGFQVGSG